MPNRPREDEAHSTHKIINLLQEYGSLGAAELARLAGFSRSWTWKLLQRLNKEGLVTLEKRGGYLIAHPSPASYRVNLRVGILRASEYPYIVPFLRKLKDRFSNVNIVVYDSAFRLATDIALGKVHLGMAPVVSHLVVHRVSGGRSLIIGGGSSGGSGVVVGSSGAGHATTMTSTMELCAESLGLEPPRVYAESGDEILGLVESGRVRYGVVWEPYLYFARIRGLRVEECQLPFCCVLGANRALEEEFDYLQRAFAESVSEAKRRLDDPVLVEAYARIIKMDPTVVRGTLTSYRFFEEPPLDHIRKTLDLIKRVVIPDDLPRQAVYY